MHPAVAELLHCGAFLYDLQVSVRLVFIICFMSQWMERSKHGLFVFPPKKTLTDGEGIARYANRLAKTHNRRKRKPRKTHKTTNPDTTSVINLSANPTFRGLTFCPTPKRTNLAELSADINDFKRLMRLKKYIFL